MVLKNYTTPKNEIHRKKQPSFRKRLDYGMRKNTDMSLKFTTDKYTNLNQLDDKIQSLKNKEKLQDHLYAKVYTERDFVGAFAGFHFEEQYARALKGLDLIYNDALLLLIFLDIARKRFWKKFCHSFFFTLLLKKQKKSLQNLKEESRDFKNTNYDVFDCNKWTD